MSAPQPGAAGPRRTRLVLIGVIGLHLVAETALTPFLPQLFDRLYGIEDPGATGGYVWACRFVGLAALPLWGLAARRVALHRLIFLGLCGSTVLDLLLGLAPSYAAFTGLSMGLVATNSAMLLAYPALIAAHAEAGQSPGGDPGEGTGRGGPEAGRLRGVCLAVVVFHLSVVVSTLVGAGVLALPEPRVGISAFAVLDALLAWVAWRVFTQAGGKTTVRTFTEEDVATPQPAAPDRETLTGAPQRDAAGRRAALRTTAVLLIVQVALLGIAFDFSVNVVRPFFTEYTEEMGASGVASAVLFFLPSVAALAMLPYTGRAHRALGGLLVPAAMLVASIGLAWQAVAPDMVQLSLGRLVFGAGLGMGQVAVDLRMFQATGTGGPAFALVETARAGALLAAPLAAATAVSHDLALPLAAGAALQVAGAVLALGLRRRRSALPSPAVRNSQAPGPASASKQAAAGTAKEAVQPGRRTASEQAASTAPPPHPAATPPPGQVLSPPRSGGPRP